MSKSANVLKMLMLLRSRRKMKIKELSDKLEVKPRMIRQYKDELEQLGVYVESDRGRYGGYYIGTDNNIFNLGITEEEFSVLKNAESYLEQEGFMFIDEYEIILDKIKSSLKDDEDYKGVSGLVLDSIPNVDLKEEKLKYIELQEAIVTSTKVEMDYFSLSSGVTSRVLQPYAMYVYQGFWYVMGYCELRNEVRQFKLSRIKELELLDEKFSKPEDFSLSEYMENCVGIRYDKDSFEVKLKIDFPMSIKVSERVWVKNQEISFNEDDSIIFEAEMTGLDDITNWVLGMGSSVEVIEPQRLKARVKEEARKIVEN